MKLLQFAPKVAPIDISAFEVAGSFIDRMLSGIAALRARIAARRRGAHADV